eukprot:1651846-Prymnesium_polylepis.2
MNRVIRRRVKRDLHWHRTGILSPIAFLDSLSGPPRTAGFPVHRILPRDGRCTPLPRSARWPAPPRSIRNQFVAHIHNCETARDSCLTLGGQPRDTARDSARQRETAARQPRIL